MLYLPTNDTKHKDTYLEGRPGKQENAQYITRTPSAPQRNQPKKTVEKTCKDMHTKGTADYSTDSPTTNGQQPQLPPLSLPHSLADTRNKGGVKTTTTPPPSAISYTQHPTLLRAGTAHEQKLNGGHSD